MKILNYEFKARMKDSKHIRAALKELRARFIGEDYQRDTYFRVPSGRLKLREGKIENALIFYRRRNLSRARRSDVELVKLAEGNSLGKVLEAALGVRAVVAKRREIYFVGNVKIHLDRVRGLGRFVEVEAIGMSRVRGRKSGVKRIREQARRFQKLFRARRGDIVPQSYSDLILRRLNRRSNGR